MTAPEADGPPTEPPAGFDAFWADTLDTLDAVEPDVREGPGPESGAEFDVRALEFRSLGGVSIGAYLARAGGEGPRPLVIHGHGYASTGVQVCRPWLRAGVDVCGIDVRGYGRSAASLPERDPEGLILTGVDSPEASFLRGAVCDHLRGIEVARRAVASSCSFVVLQGTSFAGGLATISQALRPSADLIVLRAPSLAWTEARMRLARSGSGLELRHHLAGHPERAAVALRTLAFFEALHFAGRVNCPALVGVGERDRVVPAGTVTALFERLAGPRELMTYPTSHSGTPEENLWPGFDARWLAFARDGIPADFGRSESDPSFASDSESESESGDGTVTHSRAHDR